ncbi:glycosyltransferase family 2 protein [Sphingobium yanoikuyae]|uniref:glycosyltransferase family 2 protein n=1 Tax=Sphingobium yanoikuyae TaxID=13690 RepID=UPI0022DDE4FC|nr:glycosyltransferase family 2 protein [Sphingobium yanoikuyae]WBQ19334.1 glycosyltransferase family 2 protein [Sphingobium yanoikuyae]
MTISFSAVRASAVSAFREQRFEACLDLIEQGKASHPTHRSLLTLEARAAASLGNPHRCLDAWRQLAESSELDAREHVAFTRALFDAGEVGQGFKRIAELCRDEEVGAAISAFGAPLHERLGNFAAALELWQIAMAPGLKAKELYGPRLGRARCWRGLGNHGLAVAEFQALRQVNRDSPEATIELIETLRELRQFDIAQNVLDEATAQFGANLQFSKLRAKTLNQMADEQALLSFVEEIEAGSYSKDDRAGILKVLLANRRGHFLLADTKAAFKARCSAWCSDEVVDALLRAPNPSHLLRSAQERVVRLVYGTFSWAQASADRALLLIEAGLNQEAEDAIAQMRTALADWPYFPQRYARLTEWLDVRRGAVHEAQYSWRQRRAYAKSKDEAGQLNLIRAMPAAPPSVTVFCQLRNEAPLIQAFMRHYRGLGVERFTMVDNGSDDGTLEFLAAQPDVELFSTREDFRRARAGNQWMNPLIARPEFSATLCIRVDADEHLVFPGYETQALDDVWRFMQREGADAIAGRMIDMFPERFADLEAPDGGIELCRYFDPESTALPIVVCPYFRHTGGVRTRLLGGKFQSIGKVSGIRGGGRVEYLSASHSCSPARVSSLGIALLHYKFYPGFLQKVERILTEKQHAMASQEYAHYRSFASRMDERLPSPESLVFAGSASLVDTGICQSPPEWHAFIDERATARPTAAPLPSTDADPKEPIWLHWAHDKVIGTNWGDKLNPALATFLAQRPVKHWKDAPEISDMQPVYSVIGSHIARSKENSVIWGTGFLSSEEEIKSTPRQICAVRGPLTRAKLLSQNIECPAVFGDAALLYPAMHPASRDIVWDLGIIQHIREANVEPLSIIDGDFRVKIIDISGGLADVINDIVRCRRIVSSSLHGIIASHAYGVPAAWIKFSDRPKGDGFKFHDYWATAGRNDVEPWLVGADTTIEQLAAIRSPVAAVPDVDALIEACPFMSYRRKEDIRRLMEKNFRMTDIIGQ